MNTMPWDEPSRLAYYGVDPYEHTPRCTTCGRPSPCPVVQAVAEQSGADTDSADELDPQEN